MTKLKILINFLKSFFFKEVVVNKKVIKINHTFFKNVDFKNSEIGDYSYIANNSIVHNTVIGNFCSIGPNCVIGFGDHPIHLLSTSPVFYSSDCSFDLKPVSDLFKGNQSVVIGNDVWIGANVFIKNGIRIGHGAVVGAGSIVLRDVPPYAIIVGVPGIVKSYRFSKEIVEKLLLIKWWDLDPHVIKKNFELFTSDKITENLEFILELKNKQSNF